MGLLPLYNKNEEFQFLVKRFIALAFVPEENVVEYYEALEDEQEKNVKDSAKNTDSRIEDFISYFEATYIGLCGRKGIRKKPRFSISIWNQYKRALNKEDTTSNSVESWNNAWSFSVDSRAKLWNVLNAIQREEALAKARYYEPQQNPRAEKVKRMKKDEKLSITCESFENLKPMEYLDQIAQQFLFD